MNDVNMQDVEADQPTEVREESPGVYSAEFDPKAHLDMLFNKTIQSGEFVESLALRIYSLGAVAIRDRIMQSDTRVAKLLVAKEYSTGAYKFELTDESINVWDKDEQGEWVLEELPTETADHLRTIVIADGFCQGVVGYINNDIRIEQALKALQGKINSETGALL